MSADPESAGALVTAGLVAAEIDGARGPVRPGESRAAARVAHLDTRPACRNCGASLAGAYCHACGQAAHIHRSLSHLFEEVLHGVLHFDAKGWRTLPLLVAKPGILTRRYIEGQRARYVSPLAMFLFMAFLMFFAASLGGVSPTVVDGTGEARTGLKKELADARSEAGRAEAAPAAASASAGPAGSSPRAGPADPVVISFDDTRVATGNARIDTAIRHARENPDLAFYKLKSGAYKFSFMLVPISLPFLWLLFAFRRGVAAYDHAVFVLYSLSFMSLLFVAALGVAALPGVGGFAALALLVPPVHMAFHLRDAYRLGLWATLWRTAVLLVVASVVLVLFTLFVVAVTMA